MTTVCNLRHGAFWCPLAPLFQMSDSNQKHMFFFQSATDCSAQDVKNAQSDPNAVIVDCRTHSEASAGSVKGAHVKDWLGGELHQAISSWDKSKKYFLFCRSGNRSKQATQFMRSQGFENVYNAGGYGKLRDL